MSARVYECSKSELEDLKRLLSYDPYLDPNIIPPSPSKGIPPDKMTPEQRKEMEEREKQISDSLKKLSESLKGRIIFSRQEYNIKDGASLSLKEDVVYLYLSAPDAFLDGAEERFKTELKTVKRASEDDEKKVINAIKEEEERANVGFGSIFGS